MLTISSGNENRSRAVRADFLRIDSQIALTFCGIALATDDWEKRTRTTRLARRAYDTIIRLRLNIELTNVEADKLDRNLQRLKSELTTLGEKF